MNEDNKTGWLIPESPVNTWLINEEGGRTYTVQDAVRAQSLLDRGETVIGLQEAP